MEVKRNKDVPKSVFDELHISLSAVDEAQKYCSPDRSRAVTSPLDEADPTEPIVGLARALEGHHAPLSIQARYAGEERDEILLEVERQNVANGNSYHATYLATHTGDVYSLVENDGDRLAVKLGEEEAAGIYEEVQSCRVTTMV